MMAAQLEISPGAPPSSRRVSIEDPRTFYVRISRQQWCDIPFGELVDVGADGGPAVWLDGPSLVFPERRQLVAIERELRLQRAVERYRHARSRAVASSAFGDVETRKTLAGLQSYIRRCHVSIVNLAVGYTWPRNPPGYIEFAEE